MMKRNLIFLFCIVIFSGTSFGVDFNSRSWMVSKDVNKFTDEVNVFAIVAAETGPKHGFIALTCFAGKSFEGKISVGKFIGDKVIRNNVKYRVDKKDVVETSMTAAKRFVYFNDIDDPIVKALMSGRSIIIQLTSYDYDKSVSSFTLKGSTAAISKIIEACK